jgi:hypothetical protein
MSEQKSPITYFVATDDIGGFFNLRTGEVLDVDEMLCRYGRAELESVAIGHRHQRSTGRRRSQSLDCVRFRAKRTLEPTSPNDRV